MGGRWDTVGHSARPAHCPHTHTDYRTPLHMFQRTEAIRKPPFIILRTWVGFSYLYLYKRTIWLISLVAALTRILWICKDHTCLTGWVTRWVMWVTKAPFTGCLSSGCLLGTGFKKHTEDATLGQPWQATFRRTQEAWTLKQLSPFPRNQTLLPHLLNRDDLTYPAPTSPWASHSVKVLSEWHRPACLWTNSLPCTDTGRLD